MITQVPTELITTGKSVGQVVSDGRSLQIVPKDTSIATNLYAYMDDASGTLTLGIPNFPELSISGFLTQASIKEGRSGKDGKDGDVGLSGLEGSDGEDGGRGCIGPQGPQGKRGMRGMRGKQGPNGEIGPTGPTGATGAAGSLQVFVQSEDPGDVGAGSLWVKI